MSVRVLTKVFSHSEATLASRLVLLALADAAHDDGITWVGQETIAAKTKVSEPTVRRCLRDLERLGEVETRKAQRERSRLNVYRVMMPGLAEPRYEDLPFKLAEPFSTTEDPARSSNTGRGADDRVSALLTTEDPALKSGGASLLGFEPSEMNRGEAKASPEEGALHDPPPLHKIDGQNLAWNTLAEACGTLPRDPNAAGELAAALNGSARSGIKAGIRALAWQELVEKRGDLDRLHELVTEDPERWERALAGAIEVRAEKYRQVMPGAMLTPTALAKWWLRLDGLAAERGGMTQAEMASYDG